MVKLLMKWDIKMGREQPYFEFIVRECAPGVMRLGIEPAEVWYTIYGDGPQMLTIGDVESQDQLEEVLHSSDWKTLHGKLLTYVTNYSQKIVKDSGKRFLL
jgi:hypothetical protein